MVPGYIEAEEDPIQMEIQGDKRQSQSVEIIALEEQPRVDGSKNIPIHSTGYRQQSPKQPTHTDKKQTDTFHKQPPIWEYNRLA